MLNPNIGNTILDGLFGLLNATQISFSGDIYLGLLTLLPNDNGLPYEDNVYFAEPNDEQYKRVKIDATSRINKKYIIREAQLDSVQTDENGDKFTPVFVTNQSSIMFAQASTQWEPIVGFGLFRSGNTSDTTTLPFLWGEVKSDGGENVSIDAEEIPIIRENGFKISLA
jgi:hypothetical protein